MMKETERKILELSQHYPESASAIMPALDLAQRAHENYLLSCGGETKSPISLKIPESQARSPRTTRCITPNRWVSTISRLRIFRVF